MKKLLLISLLVVGCTKSKNSAPAASGVKGCVVCKTTDVVYQDGKAYSFKTIDSTICYISDSALNAYIKATSFDTVYDKTGQNLPEKFTTTCVNQ